MEALKWTFVGLGAIAGIGGLVYWLDKDDAGAPPMLGAARDGAATRDASRPPRARAAKSLLERLDTGAKVALAVAGVGALATVAAAVIASRRGASDE